MDRVDYESIVIQELVNLDKSGGLDIDPWYQRRSVWKRPQKAYLINSVFEKKPIPTIYIRHYLDIDKEKSIKEVVDGQQRIRSILEYANGNFTAQHPNYRRRVKYSDLSKPEKTDFLMTKLSIGYLIGADDGDVIEIFGRLNSVSKTLNAQEKRNAKYSGEFKQFCLRQAARRVNLWRELNVFSANNIARMIEVQFVSDLVLNLIKGLSDYSAPALNKIYEEYDENFPQKNEIEERIEFVFSKIASLDPSSVRDTIFSRQPLFFSLFLVLDRFPNATVSTIEQSLRMIDRVFNADIFISEHEERDAEFITACTASTQRIRSRKVRDAYISSYFQQMD
ncbi:MAG TPA: DUF262 domain-containing protein [Anaerolineae bacterium]|nr:DUF262 domain-containing protein [Anaerolineae bacterium]